MFCWGSICLRSSGPFYIVSYYIKSSSLLLGHIVAGLFIWFNSSNGLFNQRKYRHKQGQVVHRIEVIGKYGKIETDKKIGFDDSFDVTKCLKQIAITDISHM